MSTTADICNLALSHLGVGTEISSLDNDRTAVGAACRRFFDICRKQVLRDASWPFATKFAALGLVASEPTTEWGYAYQYPSDALKIRRIPSGIRTDTHQSRIPFREAYGASSRLLYVDLENANVEYTVDVDEASRFPPDFVMAMSLRLAVYIAPRVTSGDPFKLGERAGRLYTMEFGAAVTNSLAEGQQDTAPEAESIRARE